MMYKIWAEIDLDALRANYRTIAAQVHRSSPDCRILSVVKADAYGHGCALTVRALRAEGCDFFAVSSIWEALQVREAAGRDADILILGYTLPEDTASLYENDIIQTVFSSEYAGTLSAEMTRLCAEGRLPRDASLRVHIKLDTGMNRIGFDTADAVRCAGETARAGQLPHLRAEGMFTHFACADEDDALSRERTERQLARFDAVEAVLRASGDCPAFLHVCNSAAGMHLPGAYKNGVRAGVILYGMPPDGGVLPGYRPVMTLRTRIGHIHTLRAGESVGYGAAYTADRPMRIATVTLGYGDGFIRAYGGASLYLPDGRSAPVVGRICMDQCMIDIGDADVRPGDIVTVFGGDGGARMEALARAGGTINYEVTSIITPRVPRVAISSEV